MLQTDAYGMSMAGFGMAMLLQLLATDEMGLVSEGSHVLQKAQA